MRDFEFEEPPNSPFDDFEDSAHEGDLNGDDDFGDFGDFDDASAAITATPLDSASAYPDDFRIPQTFTVGYWEPLELDPEPPLEQLEDEVVSLLEPIWLQFNIDGSLNPDPVRASEGVNSILVNPESRQMYNVLFNSSPPTLRAPNWVRSRIRRYHLINLGIPINLDEVMPQANGKAMPMLEVTTRPASAPPGPSPRVVDHVVASHSRVSSRAGSPRPGTPVQRQPVPVLDRAKIDSILSMPPDSLSLLPLPLLTARLQLLRDATAETSSVLTHLLQTREALQQNSETYNGLIAEMVAEAQKIKMGAKGRPTPIKKGSTPR